MTRAWGTMGGGGETRRSYRGFGEKPDRKNRWEDTGVGDSITLEIIGS